MSDDNETVPSAYGVPGKGLAGGKRILSLNDHKPKQPPKSAHYATKDGVVAAVSTGFLAMGQKVYTQAMEQTVAMMAEQDEKHAGELAALRQEIAQLRADAGL